MYFNAIICSKFSKYLTLKYLKRLHIFTCTFALLSVIIKTNLLSNIIHEMASQSSLPCKLITMSRSLKNNTNWHIYAVFIAPLSAIPMRHTRIAVWRTGTNENPFNENQPKKKRRVPFKFTVWWTFKCSVFFSLAHCQSIQQWNDYLFRST